MNGVFGVNFGDFSVGKLDESIEVERVKIEEKESTEEKLPQYDLPCLEDLFQGYKSGLGLDIAKNHTGIAIWENGKLITSGFKISVDWEKDDRLALAKLRRAFKMQLWEFLELREFDIVVVEDVYSGKNFLTVKTLILLNEVIKEMVLDRQILTDNFLKLKEAEWMKGLRQVAHYGKKMNPKVECQMILENLKFDFIKENKSKSEREKTSLFYEDRCDAAGMLIGGILLQK